MQLRTLLLPSLLIASLSAGEEKISINYLYYDEDRGRTTIHTPSLSLTKELFDGEYILSLSYLHDTVTGATPTYYDSSTGASARIPQGVLMEEDIRYGNIPYEEDREALSLTLTGRLRESRDEVKVGYTFSHEDDYISKGVSLQYLHYTDPSKNLSLTYGISYQLNYPKIPCFTNHPECDSVTGASVVTKRSEQITLQLGLTQILDKRSLIKSSLFGIIENGYLSNPYMRVVTGYGSYAPKIEAEVKPPHRKAIGWRIEYRRASEDKRRVGDLALRLYYDDWEIFSATLTGRFDWQMTEKLLIGIEGRWYRQSAAFFYTSRGSPGPLTSSLSSDRRVSSFSSYETTLCSRYRLNDTISLHLEGGYYTQPKYFDALYIMTGVEYHF
ncbi:MAG: DUF3570 domain-containing protein [Epsilonproteobacteria bacterium]|nr:hypothetical protein [Campylobacterota bacterium]NPA57320.1 DUF3570 domain-containing protein [Campylobacterota bacterium]